MDAREIRVRGRASALLLAALLLASPACAEEEGEPPGRAVGEHLYATLECGGCHESAARPGMVVRPLSKLSSRYDETSLAAYLAAPTPPMPSFPLTDAQRKELAAYLLARFP